MAIYDVIAPGFINDVYHHPDDPDHNTVSVEKKFKKCPTWLKMRKIVEDAMDDVDDSTELTPQQKAAITRKQNAEKKKMELDAVNFQEDPTLTGPTEL